MHFDSVFDVGFDYGASGGLFWDTTVIRRRSGATRRNQNRSAPLGRWQLGNRNIDGATLDYLQGFIHAMRGQVHTFLYLDWTDYRATAQQLILDSPDESQLIKSYGLSINGWIRDIRKPKASSVVIEQLDGSAWAELEAGEDYELDAATGIVTWLNDPETSDVFRWSGEFYVGARFEVDALEAQFLGLERRPSGDVLGYSIGGLPIVEEPEA
jgi:uncharacterized protein (TIGR02217 family)